MKESLLEKVRAFDKNGVIKVEIDSAMKLLKDFRARYPFAENPESIETLNPNDIFIPQSKEIGEFFRWLVYYLKPIGHLRSYPNIFGQIRNQFEDFKELLAVTVDRKKSLAQKVDAQWEQIRGLGRDKHIAKKIIFCFNYEHGDVLPIFSTDHLQHFLTEIVDKPSFPAQYVSLGETYEFLMSELLGVKESLPETHPWELPYFSRFLYDNYPPPLKNDHSNETIRRTQPDSETQNEQIHSREFAELLNELQRKEKISGEEYRDYGKVWREQPQSRESLVERLKILLSK
ncbi:MAG: hypothetical protein ABSB89_04990 [Candidatus Bathyarchaeia archaeon]|jgi:hypothetical protein